MPRFINDLAVSRQAEINQWKRQLLDAQAKLTALEADKQTMYDEAELISGQALARISELEQAIATALEDNQRLKKYIGTMNQRPAK